MRKVALLLFAFTAAALVVSMSPAAIAGEALLASFSDRVGFFSPPGALPQVQFVLQIGNIAQPLDSGSGLGTGIWWGDGDQGIVEFSGENWLGFSDFASRATDGKDNQFALMFAFADANPIGYVAPESLLLGREPDLVGHRIDFVRLLVSDVRFEPQIFKDFENFVVFAGLKYEFYGVVISEPSSFFLLAFSLASALPRRWPVWSKP